VRLIYEKKIFILIVTIFTFVSAITEIFASEDLGVDSSVLQDIKPPINLPFNGLPLIIALAVLILLVMLYFLWRFIKNKKAQKKSIIPPKSPWEIAYERLAELLKLNLPQEGKIKEYFIQVSDILRRYIEGRFSLKAPELTTPEFLEKIKKSDQLKSEHKLLLKEFLIRCDLVKFAKYGPTDKEIEESAILVKSFVDETKQVVNVDTEVENAV